MSNHDWHHHSYPLSLAAKAKKSASTKSYRFSNTAESNELLDGEGKAYLQPFHWLWLPTALARIHIADRQRALKNAIPAWSMSNQVENASAKPKPLKEDSRATTDALERYPN